MRAVLEGTAVQQSRAFVVELTLSDQFLTCMRETYFVLNASGAPMRTSMMVKPFGPRQATKHTSMRGGQPVTAQGLRACRLRNRY